MKKTPNEALDRLSIEAYKAAEKLPIVVLLDNVRSARNVGSVFRTCDAMLIEQLLLCGITAHPPNKDIRKTALGATQSVNWAHIDNITDKIAHLKSQGYTIIAVEQAYESISLPNFNDWQQHLAKPDRKYALIFGHEVEGISQAVMDVAHIALEIPQYGSKHSFNIGVSVGIVLWHITQLIKNPPR